MSSSSYMFATSDDPARNLSEAKPSYKYFFNPKHFTCCLALADRADLLLNQLEAACQLSLVQILFAPAIAVVVAQRNMRGERP